MVADTYKKLGYRMLMIGLVVALGACGRRGALEAQTGAETKSQTAATYTLDGRTQNNREDKPAAAPKTPFFLDFLL